MFNLNFSITMKQVFGILFLLGLMVGSLQAQSTQEVKIKTSAVCGMCKRAIEKDMAFEKGIKKAELDVKSQILTVAYDPKKTNPEKIRKAVSKVGYDADNVPAQPKAYSRLPECCKKDNAIHEK